MGCCDVFPRDITAEVLKHCCAKNKKKRNRDGGRKEGRKGGKKGGRKEGRKEEKIVQGIT